MVKKKKKKEIWIADLLVATVSLAPSVWKNVGIIKCLHGKLVNDCGWLKRMLPYNDWLILIVHNNYTACWETLISGPK